MMNDYIMLPIAFVLGAVLGGFFFGGLWWTVQKGLQSTRPVVWFLGSALVRTSVVLLGFYLVSDGQWQRLLACVLGFALMRPLVNRLTRLHESRMISQNEIHHAS